MSTIIPLRPSTRYHFPVTKIQIPCMEPSQLGIQDKHDLVYWGSGGYSPMTRALAATRREPRGWRTRRGMTGNREFTSRGGWKCLLVGYSMHPGLPCPALADLTASPFTRVGTGANGMSALTRAGEAGRPGIGQERRTSCGETPRRSHHQAPSPRRQRGTTWRRNGARLR